MNVMSKFPYTSKDRMHSFEIKMQLSGSICKKLILRSLYFFDSTQIHSLFKEYIGRDLNSVEFRQFVNRLACLCDAEADNQLYNLYVSAVKLSSMTVFISSYFVRTFKIY